MLSSCCARIALSFGATPRQMRSLVPIARVLRHPDLRAALDQATGDGETRAVEISIGGPIERELRATVVPMNRRCRMAGGRGRAVGSHDRT